MNLKLIKYILLTGMFVVGTISLLAQESNHQSIIGGSGHISAGLGFFDFGNINKRLVANDLPKIPQVSNSVGGGGHFMLGKFVLGTSVQQYTPKRFQFDTIKLDVRAGYGFLEVGYVALTTPRVQLYPVVGIGIGGYTIKIATVDTNLTFDELLLDPKRGIELKSGGMLLNACLNLDFFLVKHDASLPYGLLTGLEIGYTYMPKVGDWEVGGEPVKDSPKTNLNTFYVRIKLGGGGFTDRKRKQK